MPIYEYFCPDCQKTFELLRPVSQADAEAKCPNCKAIGERAISKFACRSNGVSFGAGSCGGCATASSGCSSGG